MCGIIGIIGPEDNETQTLPCWAAHDSYRGLLALQHRGQDAAGILSFNNKNRMFLQEKNLGLVAQVFNKENIENLKGHMAIGHTRYATTGTDGIQDIQPMVTGIPFGLGMVHNGNILNYHSLAKELSEKFKRQLLTTNDLELLINYLSHFLLEDSHGIPTNKTFDFKNIKSAATKIFNTFIGGYAVLSLISAEGLIAFRDPKGIRPLSIGTKTDDAGNTIYCIASETASMTYLGYTYLRDVKPGEVIFINTKGEMQAAVVHEEKTKAPCMFEWVYFSGADSLIDNNSIYSVRLKLGEQLALKAKTAIKKGEIAPDIVMPVPDTSRPAAIAVADKLGLPYREGLIKNRYVARSFILESQEKREAAVELKLSPIISEIKGKNILLVDDSIVRGTTSKKLVDMLKKYGAKEVTFGSTCPPVRFPCFYGIDFADPSVLIANGKSIDEIAEWMGANKVIYIDEEDLQQATGVSSLCMACLNNKYPTDTLEGDTFAKERNKIRAVG